MGNPREDTRETFGEYPDDVISHIYDEAMVLIGEKVAMPGRSLNVMFDIDDWLYMMRTIKDASKHEFPLEFDYGEKPVEVELNRWLEEEGKKKWVMKNADPDDDAHGNPPRTYFINESVENALEYFRL